MKGKIQQLKNQFSQEIDKISDLLSLGQMEIKYLGRKAGELTKILRQLKDFSVTQRREIGQAANQLKKEIEDGRARQAGGVPFEKKMQTLSVELKNAFGHGKELEERIIGNLKKLGV